MRARSVITIIRDGLMVTVAARETEVVIYASRETASGSYEHIGTIGITDQGGEFKPAPKVTVSPKIAEEACRLGSILNSTLIIASCP